MKGSKYAAVALALAAGILGTRVIPLSYESGHVQGAQPEKDTSSPTQRVNEVAHSENLETRVNNSTHDVSASHAYESFRYQEEVPAIVRHASRYGVEPELLMAIRTAENGGAGREYGILPQGENKVRYNADKGYNEKGTFHAYTNEGEKQLAWAAATVKAHQKRYNADHEGYGEFISYLAAHYAPQGVSNDPQNLNRNWKKNVKQTYTELKKTK